MTNYDNNDSNNVNNNNNTGNNKFNIVNHCPMNYWTSCNTVINHLIKLKMRI